VTAIRSALLALAAGALALAGCSTNAETAIATPAPRVGVVRPTRADAVRTITLPGDVAGRNEAALYAKVTGYLRSIAVDKGDWVKKGQVLAEIEVPELQEKLKRARADLQVRRVTYQRLQGVWNSDKRLVAREDVDVAEGAFQQAEANVEELEAMVGYTHLIAPFDGVITARYVDPGALIRADGDSRGAAGAAGAAGGGHGGPVLSLADTDALRVYVYAPEDATSLVRQGQAATIRFREYPGREFTGAVTRFANALDLSTRTMLTEIDIDNRKHELYPGMYADVTLELERHAGALEVPTTAVGGTGDDRFVLVVDGSRIRKQRVTTGIADAGVVEIREGLRGDERIVQHLNPGLADGDTVEAVDVEPPPAVAHS